MLFFHAGEPLVSCGNSQICTFFWPIQQYSLFFCNQPKTNAVFYCNFFWPTHLMFFVIHTTHIKPSLNLDDLPPRRKQFWFVDQGVGAWCSQWPGARNPCLFQNIKYFSSGNKTPKDRLNIQVPGLAVPGGTWFTRLVQSGDKNSAYSLFRCI